MFFLHILFSPWNVYDSFFKFDFLNNLKYVHDCCVTVHVCVCVFVGWNMINSCKLSILPYRLTRGVKGSKEQGGQTPSRHILYWFMSIWQNLFPDKACSDVWVSVLSDGKSEKLVPHHRRSFLPSLRAPPTWQVFRLLAVQTDHAKSQTAAQTQVGHWSWQVYSQTAGHWGESEGETGSAGAVLNCT